MLLIGKRLLQLIVVFVCVTFFTVLLISMVPGKPEVVVIPFDSSGHQREDFREDNHLDRSIFVQWGYWARDFVRGDMGDYYTSTGKNPVSDRIGKSLPISLLLILYVQLVSLGIYILGVKLNLVPTDGYTAPSKGLTEHFKSMVVPVLALSLGQIAVYMRLLRSDLVATLQEDFILMAKAKGISNRRVLWRHALRPSSLTLLTVAGQSMVAIIAIFFVLMNFLIDYRYTVLDPRIRERRS